jgi:hypothetical protein
MVIVHIKHKFYVFSDDPCILPHQVRLLPRHLKVKKQDLEQLVKGDFIVSASAGHTSEVDICLNDPFSAEVLTSQGTVVKYEDIDKVRYLSSTCTSDTDVEAGVFSEEKERMTIINDGPTEKKSNCKRRKIGEKAQNAPANTSVSKTTAYSSTNIGSAGKMSNRKKAKVNEKVQSVPEKAKKVLKKKVKILYASTQAASGGISKVANSTSKSATSSNRAPAARKRKTSKSTLTCTYTVPPLLVDVQCKQVETHLIVNSLLNEMIQLATRSPMMLIFDLMKRVDQLERQLKAHVPTVTVTDNSIVKVPAFSSYSRTSPLVDYFSYETTEMDDLQLSTNIGKSFGVPPPPYNFLSNSQSLGFEKDNILSEVASFNDASVSPNENTKNFDIFDNSKDCPISLDGARPTSPSFNQAIPTRAESFDKGQGLSTSRLHTPSHTDGHSLEISKDCHLSLNAVESQSAQSPIFKQPSDSNTDSLLKTAGLYTGGLVSNYPSGINTLEASNTNSHDLMETGLSTVSPDYNVGSPVSPLPGFSLSNPQASSSESVSKPAGSESLSPKCNERVDKSQEVIVTPVAQGNLSPRPNEDLIEFGEPTSAQVKRIELQARSRQNFAWRMMPFYFRPDEMYARNCHGIKKQALDQDKLDKLRTKVLSKWPVEKKNQESQEWRKCELAIDKGLRSIKTSSE